MAKYYLIDYKVDEGDFYIGANKVELTLTIQVCRFFGIIRYKKKISTIAYANDTNSIESLRRSYDYLLITKANLAGLRREISQAPYA